MKRLSAPRRNVCDTDGASVLGEIVENIVALTISMLVAQIKVQRVRESETECRGYTKIVVFPIHILVFSVRHLCVEANEKPSGDISFDKDACPFDISVQW